MIPESSAQKQIRTKDIVFAVILAATSGIAILTYAFAAVPMSLTVPFVVMPAMALITGAILRRRRLYSRLRVVADLLMLGCWTGLASTFAYDLIRPLLNVIFHLKFNPFLAMPVFGHLITGLPPEHPFAVMTGWIYHFCNGSSFGAMFALFRPQGGVATGLFWGLGLQCLMLATYPHLLQIRLDDPGFLYTGLAGHALWGVILGSSIAKWGPNA